MIQRFKIEDLVIQDTSGVVFKAIDEETGLPVSVRRFFPFGIDGGGLDDAMQADYSDLVARLVGIGHPALCSVIDGGCDPVDDMPYLVTEWMDGTPMIDFLENRSLSPSETAQLIMPLMEVCQLLSDAIGRERIWIETDFGSITMGAPQSHRPATFRISPMMCLGQFEGHGGLFPLVELTARVTGWHQGVPEDLSATGIGAWLNWLHGACESATIREAMEQLAIATGAPAPGPSKTRPVISSGSNTATRRLLPGRPVANSKSSVTPWLLGGLVLAGLGLGGWILIQKNGILATQTDSPVPSAIIVKTMESRADEPPAPEIPKSDDPSPPDIAIPAEPVELRAPVPTAKVPAAPVIEKPVVKPAPSKPKASPPPPPIKPATSKPPIPPVKPTPVAVKPPTPPAAPVFNAGDQKILLGQKGNEITVEGTVEAITFSNSKETMYLVLSKNKGASSFRGSIQMKIAKGGLSEDAMKLLVGKNIQITGVMAVEPPNRPIIRITQPKAIQLTK